MKRKAIAYILGATFLLSFIDISMAASPADFTGLVKSAGSAVVNINTETTEEIRTMPPGFRLFRKHPFMDQFSEQFEESLPRESQKRNSLGSGFIISADGYIVTNNHVVEGADVIRVTIGEKNKEQSYTANIIGVDPETDLALLKIEAENLPVLIFGDSDALEVGEWVVAIGNPFGLDHTVTAGILSAKGRNISFGKYNDFLQTDASINRGNSGGPLLNMKGEVIGINAVIAQDAQGIGFAIPSSLAQKIINDLRNHRKVSRGWLGITIQDVDPATAKALGMKEATGALVGETLEGQPADLAGIKAGDVILAINKESIADTASLLRTVALLTPGKSAEATIWRNGKALTFPIAITERDGGTVVSLTPESKNNDSAFFVKLGITVRLLAPKEMNASNVVSGLLVTEVKNGGLAAETGIRAGDIIKAVNLTPMTNVKDFEKVMSVAVKENGVLLFHISRNGGLFFRAIDFGELKK